MLDSITLYVGSYLSEIGDTFSRLVACINSADKAIKDFDFAGVRFLIQFVNKNTVNKFMDVFVGQFFNRCVSAYQCDKPFTSALRSVALSISCDSSAILRVSVFFFIIAGSQKSKLFI